MPDPILNPTENDELPTEEGLKSALDSMRETLANMPAHEINRTPRLDPAAAAGVAIGSLPRVAQHRDAVVARCGADAARVFDLLPVIAYATHQAHVEAAALDDDGDLREHIRDLLEEHKLLLTDGDALANRKLLDRARIDAGRPIQGYRTVVDSTLILIAVLRESWSRISVMTPLQPEDLARAEGKAKRVLDRLNRREQGTNRMPAVEVRARALSMLIDVYSEVQRYLTFVRWKEADAETIAPSLYTSRRARRTADNGGVIDPTEPGTPIGPLDPLAPLTPAEPVPNNGGAPFTS